MMRSGQGEEEVDQKEMIRLMDQDPDIAGVVLKTLQKTGQLDFSLPAPRAPSADASHTTRHSRPKKKKNRRK